MVTKIDFRVEGLDCSEEAALLRDALSGRDGVDGVAFHIVDARMTVRLDTDVFNAEQVKKVVERLGMRADLWEEPETRNSSWWRMHGRRTLVLLSGFSLVLGFVSQVASGGHLLETFLSHGHGVHEVHPAAQLCFVTAIVAGLFYSVRKATGSLIRLRPDMNALVLVSVVGAAFLAEWAEAATLACLYGLSGLIENWSASRARNAIGSLLRISPATASVVHDGHEHRVPVDRVSVGARVRVRPGERIPCDASVVSGSSFVDQALVSGESVPAWKKAGDSVFAGTVNGHGVIEIVAIRAASDTTLARIIRMVGESHHHRAQSERFIDQFARYYTPAMFAVAVVVGATPPLLYGADWEQWFYQAMLILLMSCPCALVISTPVTIAAAITSATRHGVIIKGGVFLEELARLRAIAFDKTGVMTRGEPEVREFKTIGSRSEADVLARLLALEQHSEHPLSRAFVRYAEATGVAPSELVDFEAIEGKGVEATIDGDEFWVGSARFALEKTGTVDLREELLNMQGSDRTVVVCGSGEDVWALVSVADPVRSEAKNSISLLHSQGIRSALLTGDNADTASSVGRQVGVVDVHAELLPDDKVRVVQEFIRKHGPTAMVGDGINDSQALITASVGVAVGARATDVAVESADVVLMQGNLRKLPFLVGHARRARSVIIQNVSLALGAKAVFLAFMMLASATLWMAVIADMGATLMVTFNGLRMLRPVRLGVSTSVSESDRSTATTTGKTNESVASTGAVS